MTLQLRERDMHVGFIINPVAGMGGIVGFKGTDGVVKEAIAKGAKPVAPQRAKEFLNTLKLRTGGCFVEFLCCPGKMGANEVLEAGLNCQVLSIFVGEETSGADTKAAVKLMKSKVDLIVFVGGDGTARDVFDAIKKGEGPEEIPVIGVPAGVKMYSGVFAVNPRAAAEAVASFLDNQTEIADFEIMDTDEEAIRKDVFDVKIYGYIKGLSVPALIQGSKEVSPETRTETQSQAAIAKYIFEEVSSGVTLILGPGTTVERIAEALGVKKTVLGVDLYSEGKIMLDVDENLLLKNVKDWKKTWIILSPIGHQGMLLGRGNQQISPQIVKLVGKKHILVVATLNKLSSISGELLRVDTGDEEVNSMLRGEVLVITGYREGVTMQIQ